MIRVILLDIECTHKVTLGALENVNTVDIYITMYKISALSGKSRWI